MDQSNWKDIERELNSYDSYFHHDGGFANALDLDRSGNIPMKEQKTEWLQKEQYLEDKMIGYHATTYRCFNNTEIETLDFEAKLISEKKILVSGVTKILSVDTFLPWNSFRTDLVKNLFEVAQVAIEAFQESPTALVLFPKLRVSDARVMGGWYGSPWGDHNANSLRTYFREINPWFDIRIVSIRESERSQNSPEQRQIAIHFTYKALH